MKEVTKLTLYSVVRSRAQIYSTVRPRFTPIPKGDGDRSVHSCDIDRNDETTFSHRSTDNVSLQKSSAESQLSPKGYGPRQTESPCPSLNPATSLANAKSRGRLFSSNSLFSGSCPPCRPTVSSPTYRSVMSDEKRSARASTGLGLGEHGWGQIEPTTPPFLDSGESLANAKFGGRVVPLNPLLSRDRSPGRQTVA